MIDIDECPWCPGTSESTKHALFDCPSVKQLWVESECKEFINTQEELNITELLMAWKE